MYRNSGQHNDKVISWGAPHSFWTGRMRSYLIKKGIDFQQIYPANPRYNEDIVPKIGYFVMPVTEFIVGRTIPPGSELPRFSPENTERQDSKDSKASKVYPAEQENDYE